MATLPDDPLNPLRRPQGQAAGIPAQEDDQEPDPESGFAADIGRIDAARALDESKINSDSRVIKVLADSSIPAEQRIAAYAEDKDRTAKETALVSSEYEARRQKIVDAHNRRKANAAARKESAETGRQFLADENGLMQPVKDPATGKDKFTPDLSPVRYDEKTGRPFRVRRDEQGTQFVENPDSEAKIGANPDDPTDRNLYRQNKEKSWDVIDPEVAAHSSDPKLAVEAGKHLHGLALKDVSAKLSDIDFQLSDPSKKSGRLTDKERAKEEKTVTALANDPSPESQQLLSESKAKIAADDELKGLQKQEFDLKVQKRDLEKLGPGGYLQKVRSDEKSRLAALPEDQFEEEAKLKAEDVKAQIATVAGQRAPIAARVDEITNTLQGGVDAATSVKLLAERQALIDQDSGLVDQHNAAVAKINDVDEAQKIRAEKRKAEVKADRDEKRKDPKLAPIANALDALDAETESRVAKVESEPDPEKRKIAMEALNSDIKTKRDEIYQSEIKKVSERQAKINEFDNLFSEAAKHGVDVDTYLIEVAPDGEYKKSQELGGQERAQLMAEAKTQRELATGSKSAGIVNGDIRIAPAAVWDDEKLKSTIKGMDGATEKQKADAIAAIPVLKREAAKVELPFFQEIKGFNAFVAKNPNLTTPEEQIAEYKRRNSGWYKHIPEQIKIGLTQGYAGLIQATQVGIGVTALLANELRGKPGERSGTADAFLGAAIDDQGGQIESLGRMSQNIGGSPEVAGMTNTLTQMVPLIAVPLGASVLMKYAGVSAAAAENIGMAGSASLEGFQQAASTFVDATKAVEDRLIQGGMDPRKARDEAQKQAFLPAIATGITTAGITALGGKKGAEAVFRPSRAEIKKLAGNKAFLNTVKELADVAFKDAIQEGILEEAPQQIAQAIVESLTYNPDKTLKEAVDETIQAAVYGSLLGGVMGGGKEVWEKTTEKHHLRKTYQPRPGVNLEDVALADKEIRQSGGSTMPDARTVQKQRETLLAQVQAEPDPAKKEAIGTQIAAMDDYLRVVPVNIPRESRPDLARAMVKIAQGVPLENLSDAERTVVQIAKTTAGVKFIEDEGGTPIITDNAREWLRGVSPKADALIGMDAATAREAAKAKNAKTQTPQAEPEPSAEGGANAPADQPGQPAAGSTWTAAGVNGTPVSVTAASKAEAQQKLSSQLPSGEMLDPDSINETPAKQNETASEGEAPAPQQQGPAASQAGQNAPASGGDSQTAENPAVGNVAEKETSPEKVPRGTSNRDRWKGQPISKPAKLAQVVLTAKGVKPHVAEAFARQWVEQNPGKSVAKNQAEILQEFRDAGGKLKGESTAANYNTSEDYWKAQGMSPMEAAEAAKNARDNRTADDTQVDSANESLANKILDDGGVSEASASVSESAKPAPFSKKVAQAIAAVPQEHRARAAKLVAKFSKAMNKYGAGFDSIEIVPGSLGTAGARYNAENKSLQLSLDDIETWSDADMESGMQAVAGEEALHRVTTDMEKSGEFKPVEFWKTLPAPMRRLISVAIKNNAGVKASGDWARGHEAIRILLQADSDEFGKAVTEAIGIDPKWSEKFRAFLAKLTERLQNALSKLRDQNTPEAKSIKEVIALAEKRAAELGIIEKSVVGGAGAPYESGNGSGNDGSGNQAGVQPNARGQLRPADGKAGQGNVVPERVEGPGIDQASVPPAAPVGGTPPVPVGQPGEAASKKLPPARFGELGDKDITHTDNNDPVEFQWAVADVDDLVISNDDIGNVNPDYPEELQPRDRSSKGSQMQVDDIAKNANFRRLSSYDTAGGGAPIVGPEDGVAESGNGRLMGLRRAYKNKLPSIDEYRAQLIANAGKFGLTPEAISKIKNPVLVRVRQTLLDRKKFAEAANVSNISPMREVEVAKKDAGNITADLVSLFNPSEEGDIFSTQNQEFIKAFVNNVVPQGEYPDIIDSRGNLSQTGVRRIRNAIFAYAYGTDAEAMNALGRMTESVDADGKNLTNALLAAAPKFAEQASTIAKGGLYDLPITGDLIKAVQEIVDIRNRGEKVGDSLAQQEMFGERLTPFQKDLVSFLDKNARSGKRITEALRRYSAALDGMGNPQQAGFFDTEAPTKEGLWNLAKHPAAQTILSSGDRRQTPQAWAKAYNKLFALQRSGEKLTPGQQLTMNRAERELGQSLMFEQAAQQSPEDFDRESITRAIDSLEKQIAADKATLQNRMRQLTGDQLRDEQRRIIGSMKEVVGLKKRLAELPGASAQLAQEQTGQPSGQMTLFSTSREWGKYDMSKVMLGQDIAQAWQNFPRSETELPELPDGDLKNLAEQFLSEQPRFVSSAFGKQVVLHKVGDIKGTSQHYVAGNSRIFAAEPNRVRVLKMLANTVRNAMAYASAGQKGRFAYLYRYNDGTVHVVIVQNAAVGQRIERQFTVTQYDHNPERQTSPIRILRKNGAGPQPTATPEPAASQEIGSSTATATSKPIRPGSGSVNENLSSTARQGVFMDLLTPDQIATKQEQNLFAWAGKQESEIPATEAKQEPQTVIPAKTEPEAPPAGAQEQETAIPEKSSEPTPGAIEDFGIKLGGARKDRSASIAKEFTDDDIAGKTLSEIWPKAEVDAIEDTQLAAVATAIRSEVPAKPRKGYKLERWVETVKLVRGLMRHAEEKGFDEILRLMDEKRLENFTAKIRLLSAIPRETWGRIGDVRDNPKAMRFVYDADRKPVIGEDGRQKTESSPYSSAQVDSGRIMATNLTELAEKVTAETAQEKAAPKMEFQVRGRSGSYFINKKGDPLYRHLKEFTDSKEALDFVRSNHGELVKAWEDVKESDNVKERDLRTDSNRPRTGSDHRGGRDVTSEMFQNAFGFRGVEFGNWVSQGENARERQGMLNQAFDALHDLAAIIGVPPRAVSLNGELGLGFGSRGKGGFAAAHYEPGTIVINLTKTKGAGTLAHEWFHALDHYFQRQRNSSGVYSGKGDFITGLPEAYYVGPEGQRLPESRYNELMARPYNASRLMNWKRVEGVRPAVLEAFNDLVKALDASPMAKRAELIDKGKSDGYWSRIIERAARSFENYTIFKMAQQGYHNDYLANVVPAEDFSRDMGRYPYLLDSEMKPVAEAFDNLFGTVQTRETEKGVALYSTARETAKKYVSGLDLPRNIQHEAERAIGLSIEEIDRLRETYDLFGDETFGSKSAPELFGAGNQSVSPQTGDRSLQSGEVSEEEYSRLVESGLKGDWEALGKAVAARGTASSIFKDLVGGNVPGQWDIVGTKIESPADFAALLMPLRSPYVESLKVAVLDDNNRVVSQHIISVGSLDQSIAHPREIFGPLARLRESSGKNFTRIIMAHNHPSGDPAPSSADRRMTRAINEGAELMGFTVVDHVITNGQKFFSFRDSGVQDFHTETGGLPANISKKLDKKAPAWDSVKDKLAPWERIQRLDLALVDGSPEHQMQSVIAGLRQADPKSGHIIALNTRLHILGVRRVTGMLEQTNAEVFRQVFKMATEEGAYAFAVHMPGERTKRTDDMIRGLRAGASLAQIHFIDGLTVDADGRIESAAEHGLMEDATQYGKRVLASTGRQQTLDLGMYSNPGELDFSKTEPKQTPGELVKENLGLATSIAQKYFNIPGVENDDVIQQARKGLVRAARAFDPGKGKFSSFAWRVIQNELNDLYGRQMKVATNEAVSLDEPIGRDSAGNDATRYDVMPDRTDRGPLSIEREETAAIIKTAVDSLPEQPRTIVRMSMQGLDGEEIASKLGISRQRVNLVLQNAQEILRRKLTQQGLTGQENGILYSTGRGDGSVEDLLKELRRDMPSLAEIEAFRQRANAEPEGARTIGVPSKAKYSPDTETRRATDVVQQLREDRMARETEDKWISDAEGMLKRDKEGVKRTLLQKALDPAKYGTFTATEVKAAQLLVPELMRRAFREKSLALRKEAFALAWAYDAGGSEQARAFSARRDPFKSPAERHTEFLTKIVSTPTAEQRKHIDAAPDAKERQSRLEAAQNERLDKIEKALAGMGIKMEDIFSGEAYVRLKGAAMVENAMGAYDAKKRKALRLIQDQFPDSEISRVTGLSVPEINTLEREFMTKLSARLDELGDDALDLKNFDIEALFSSARPDIGVKLTAAEREARKAEILKAMGFGRAETRNKKELIKRRKPKRRYPVQSYDGPVPSDDPVQAEKLRQQGLEWDENRKAWNRNPNIPGNEPLPTDAMKQERIRYDSDQPWEYVKFDPASKDQVVRAARIMQAADGNWTDMFYEAWMNSILSGPQTHVTNILGNGAMATWEYLVQRPMEVAINSAVGDANSTQLGELSHIYRAAMPGIMNGWRAAVRAFSSEHDFFENDVLNSQIEFSDFDKGGNVKASISGNTGRIVRVPGRALMAMDAFFKYATGQMEAAGQAYRIAQAQGLAGEAMESEIRTQINMPGSMAWQRAVAKAKDLTFQNELPEFMKKVSNLRSGRNATTFGGRLMSLLLGMTIPFIKTPFNIFRTGLRKSPLGAINVMAHIAQGLYSMKNGRPFVEGYSKAQLVRDMAEQALAFGATALLMGAIEGDDDDDKKWLLITGGRPYGVDNQGERDLLNRTSGGQYQIRIGGRNGFYFNYGRLEPFATTLGTVATAVRLGKTEKTVKDFADRLFANMASQATDKTFMQGIENVVSTIDGITTQGTSKTIEKSAKGLLSSLVPNLIRQPIRNWDDAVRDGKYAGMGYTLTAAPGLAEQRSDIYGKPMQKQGNAVSRLFFPAGIVPTPILERGDQFLRAYNRNAPEPYTPERPREYKLKNARDQWVAMTPQQIAEFDRKSGILFAAKLKSWLTPYAIEHPTEEHKKQFADDLAAARAEVKSRMFAK